MRKVLLLLLAVLIVQCDRDDSDLPLELLGALECEIATTCPVQQTKFGLVGDSWTDFAFGAPIQKDLLDTLRDEYGYNITASALAGLTVRREVEEKRGYINVINTAGPDLSYMLISLGGNDLLASTSEYVTDGIDFTINQRLASIELRLDRMIIEGNFLKQQNYGGNPPVWFFHGYDYANPNKETSCISGAINAGLPEEAAKTIPPVVLNRFNSFLATYTTRNASARYLDLRGTLGGPDVSNPDLMFDCIHPNTLGHSLIAARYHETLKGYTGDVR